MQLHGLGWECPQIHPEAKPHLSKPGLGRMQTAAPRHTRTPGGAALTLWQDEHHGQQRQDPMGTSGHVSAEHGGRLLGSPRAHRVDTGLWGSGLRPPLLPAPHPGRARPRRVLLTCEPFQRDSGRCRRCSRDLAAPRLPSQPLAPRLLMSMLNFSLFLWRNSLILSVHAQT